MRQTSIKNHIIFTAVLICLCMFAKSQVTIPDSLDVEDAVEDQYSASAEENANKQLTDSIVVRHIPDTVTQKIKQRKEFAYANDAEYWKKEKVRKNTSNNNGLSEKIDAFFHRQRVRSIAYIFLIIIILYLIYRVIVVNNLYIFYHSKIALPGSDEEHELIHDEKIHDKIDAAIKSGDHRMAVRYLYIETLQGLQQRGLIRYQADATNGQYVQQLNNNPKATSFRFLTEAFEYVWYGEFTLTRSQFDSLHFQFLEFRKALHL